MKNLMKIAVVLLISLTTSAQTPLVKIVNTNENIGNISLNGNELVFNTSSNLYSYECGGNLNEEQYPYINDIYNGEALTGDTIGKSNYNNGTYLLSTPYNEVYPLYITDGVGANPYITFSHDLTNDIYIIETFEGQKQLSSGQNPYLSQHNDFDYYDNQLIITLGGNSSIYFYDIATDILRTTTLYENGIFLNIYPSSSTVYNDTLYLAYSNKIYKVTSVVDNTSVPLLLKDVEVELYYSIPGTGNGAIVINEFEFDSSGNVYASTIEGIYSDNICSLIALSVEEDNILNDVTLYPNPNNGNFTITNVEYETTLNILNTNGQIVYSELTNQETITLNTDLPNGIYFIQLTNGNTNTTLKFIKE